MIIQSINNHARWNDWLLLGDQFANFLQSFEWGEILKTDGKSVERLAILDGGEIVAQAQVIYMELPWGWSYAFCPGGPILNFKFQNSLKTISNEQIFKYLSDYFSSKKCIFLRIEPKFKIQNLKLSIHKSPDLTPRATTILNFNKSNDQLLAAMHEKTRYNIRLALKKNLVIQTQKDAKIFLQLSQKTAARDAFRLHPKEHYQSVLASPLTHQITIFLEDKAIATAIFIGFGDTFTYLFGASDHTFRQLMAPYLIQWEGIQLGRKLNYRYYDFFGVAPATPTFDPHHQYAGVTRFKLGFGGPMVENPGTYDLIISPIKYRVYQTLRKIRRLI